MDNYLITWFYAEHKEDESFYPAVGGSSSSEGFQNVYWRCVYDFYMSAFITQERELKYLFFTNVEEIPRNVDGIDISAFFKKHGIEVINCDISYRTPKDWFFQFRNQFYVYDIINRLKDIKGRHLLLDSDCFFTRDISGIFKRIGEKGAEAYAVPHGDDFPINGITLNGMRRLYREFCGERGLKELEYLGGEFIALTSDSAERVMEEYKKLWEMNYQKYENGQEKLNEEAHFWSFLFYKLGFGEPEGNSFIRRIWTAARLDDLRQKDAELAIMHLPAEKKYGFKKMFAYLSASERTKEEYIKEL
ncbi:MAG: hypothetical protein J6O55_03575, partial [Lachnospiraceae bacterium]|nr:hypothetical protein [Lachnospiraceae bacterium]